MSAGSRAGAARPLRSLLPVDPAGLRFLFQGLLEAEKAGRNYGEFPWRLGLLSPADPAR